MADNFAPLWDSLFFKSLVPPTDPGVPMPSPNPLRTPQEPPPVAGMGAFLNSVFQLPQLDFWNPSNREIELRRAQNDAAARQYYNAPEGGVPLPERAQRQAPVQPQEPVPTEEGEEDQAGVPPLPERAGVGGQSAGVVGPDGQPRQIAAPASINPFSAALLQLGLSLMTPSWGNPLSQIGQAAGQGLAAAGRAQTYNEAEQRRVEQEAERDEDRSGKRALQQAQTEKTQAETELLKTGVSSRARRLGSRQPSPLDLAADEAGLGPKGKLYLQQRVKELNNFDPLVDEGEADPVARFNTILEEAKKLDAPSAPAKPANKGGTETVQGADAGSLPLYNTPADVRAALAAKTLKSGDQFRFVQDGKEVIGRVP